MNKQSLNIVIIGLSLSSSWGNGHATTYRSLVKGLRQEGHQVIFLEREVPWYAAHRDLLASEDCRLYLYQNLEELQSRYAAEVREADLVIVGSYVPEGVAVGNWVLQQAKGIRAFYDIDTPVTLDKLNNKDYEYLHPEQIAQYDLYLSFTGGPTLQLLEQQYGSPAARALYCSVDTDLYFPQSQPLHWQLGYLGTYSADRQPTVSKFLIEVAAALPDASFVVAGPQYPEHIDWPDNVKRIAHLPPAEHAAFYNQQRYTLNVTRQAMIAAGYAPSVRLFEAAACGVPIISDAWAGLETLFVPEREILIADSTQQVTHYLVDISEKERMAIGTAARQRVLQEHSSRQRAKQLAAYVYAMHGAIPEKIVNEQLKIPINQ